MRNKIIALLVILAIFIMPSTASSVLSVKPVQTQITVAGKSITGPFITYNDTTYVPIRKLCEAAGFTVDYKPGNITVNKDILNKVSDSQSDNCVYIKAESNSLNYFEEGSGVIYGDQYVITCYHVVKGFDKFTILNNYGTQCSATLLKCNAFNDVAILKMEYRGPMSTTILGDSSTIAKSDTLLTISSPKGVLNVPSTGVYPTISNDLTFYANKVYAGSSGGGVYNYNGELVGIIQAGSNTTKNMEYAIPANKIKPLLSGLD